MRPVSARARKTSGVARSGCRLKDERGLGSSDQSTAIADPRDQNSASRCEAAPAAAEHTHVHGGGEAEDRPEVGAFLRDERASTTDVHLFVSTSYPVLIRFETAAGGRLATPVVGRLINTYKLVGPRGGPVKPKAFRDAWDAIKLRKKEEAALREHHRSGKAGWRSAIADPQPIAAAAPPSDADAMARSRGPPSAQEADFDIEAEIEARFAERRARLAQMPMPQNTRNGTQW